MTGMVVGGASGAINKNERWLCGSTDFLAEVVRVHAIVHGWKRFDERMIGRYVQCSIPSWARRRWGVAVT
jgi:hypothetical protein